MPFPLLKNILSDQPKLKPVVKTPEVKRITNMDQDSLIMDAEIIEKEMEKLQTKHTLLTVEIGSHPQYYSSLILECNARNGYLVLDEFYPDDINANIILGEQLDISSNNAGVSIRFVGEIEDIAEKRGAPYYKIGFPDIIEYSQRRQSHRIPVSLSAPIKVIFNTSNDMLLHGELRDLSLGGFSCRLTPPIMERLKPDDEIPKCILQMPDHSRIVCSVDVRRVFVSNTSGVPMLGCKFLNMNTPDERSLQSIHAKMERELMRKIHRT